MHPFNCVGTQCGRTAFQTKDATFNTHGAWVTCYRIPLREVLARHILRVLRSGTHPVFRPHYQPAMTVTTVTAPLSLLNKQTKRNKILSSKEFNKKTT
jgi:hypothetical protein